MGRRWLGKKHAIRVDINPLHYTPKLEDSRRCIRCSAVMHASAFDMNGVEVGVCAACRKELFERYG